ncbi:MAG TPA: cyanophycinase [Thermoanaerobaculia bacterium]|nr:cyanophycinase [Thermoanaerobaculia bacterium]
MANQKQKKQGRLIIIGGGEKKDDRRKILERVAREVGSGKLVVSTVGTSEPEETWKEYRQIFKQLGVKNIEHLDVRNREEALAERTAKILDGATAVFFTGGDQLKITSQLGDSQAYRKINELYEHGGTVAGTSAGASVMSETMLIGGDGEKSHQTDRMIQMAPGFGLVKDVVIDQHFAERGRLGRLLAAVAQNPAHLGVGIDENTAVILSGEESFEVIGEGAVYILDGRKVSYSNLTEEEQNGQTLSVFDIKLHVLSEGNRYDLQARRPEVPPKPEEQAEVA